MIDQLRVMYIDYLISKGVVDGSIFNIFTPSGHLFANKDLVADFSGETYASAKVFEVGSSVDLLSDNFFCSVLFSGDFKVRLKDE